MKSKAIFGNLAFAQSRTSSRFTAFWIFMASLFAISYDLNQDGLEVIDAPVGYVRRRWSIIFGGQIGWQQAKGRGDGRQSRPSPCRLIAGARPSCPWAECPAAAGWSVAGSWCLRSRGIPGNQ